MDKLLHALGLVAHALSGFKTKVLLVSAILGVFTGVHVGVHDSVFGTEPSNIGDSDENQFYHHKAPSGAETTSETLLA